MKKLKQDYNRIKDNNNVSRSNCKTSQKHELLDGILDSNLQHKELQLDAMDEGYWFLYA